MKYKKLISLIASASVLCSSLAFAAAVRFDPYSVVEIPDRRKPNDIFFEDFTSVEEGFLPSSTSGQKNDNINVTTASYDIGGGAEKNCLVIDDLNHAAAYSGGQATVSVGNQTGLIGVEIRYKYLPSETSNWASFEMQFKDLAGKQISRTCVASGNGTTHFNYGGPGTYALEATRIVHDGWYTLTYVLDLDEKRLDGMLTNETTGVVTQTLNSEYYQDGGNNLTNLNFVASYYGGTYVIDYIRVTKETGRMEESETVDNIEKGRPAETVAKPVSHAVKEKVNITLDGKYKYTTKNPVVEGEAVLVTAKNVASIFNLSYYMTVDGAVIKSDKNLYTIAPDGSGIKKNKNPMSLSASCKAEDKQVFIPIGDIAEDLGYEYSYNSETNTVEIKTVVAEETEKEAE